MQVLILAGGFGSRLMPVIYDRPKVMAPIKGRPFLEYIINQLSHQNFKEIILSLGYLSNYIKDYFGTGASFGVKLKYSQEPMPLGTAGAIKLASSYLGEEFMVLNGDTYLPIEFNHLTAFHTKKGADLTICLSQHHHKEHSSVVLLSENGQVQSFSESEKLGKPKKGFLNAGAYVVKKKIFSTVSKNQKVSFEKEVIPTLIKRNFTVFGYPIENDYYDIGTPDSYRRTLKIFEKINF